MSKTISVIIAAYNEEKNIAGTVQVALSAIQSNQFDDYEIIIFDDKSTDATPQLIDQLSRENPKIIAVHNERNQGFGYAFSCGVPMARMGYVCILPGDNEHEEKSIAEIFRYVGKADIVVPFTTNVNVRPFSRQIISKLYVFVLNMAFRCGLRYYTGPAIHRRELLKGVDLTCKDFAFMSTLLVRLIRLGHSFIEVPICIKSPGGRKTKAFKIKNIIKVCATLMRLFWDVEIKNRRQYDHFPVKRIVNNSMNIMNSCRAPFVSLKDIMVLGRDFLVPKKPCSLYRYIEYLVEITLVRKYQPQGVLEVGPGLESIFKYLKEDDYPEGTLLDNLPAALDFSKEYFADNRKIEVLSLDILDEKQVAIVDRKWDMIVCNGLLEHVPDDKILLRNMRALLKKDGIIICTTVLGKALYNDWDRAMGHYRRYSTQELVDLFSDFKEIQLIKTSLLQELVRPLFTARVKHLLKNSLEENNKLVAQGFLLYGKPPYERIFPVLRYLMPLYLVWDWTKRSLFGGVGFMIAKNP